MVSFCIMYEYVFVVSVRYFLRKDWIVERCDIVVIDLWFLLFEFFYLNVVGRFFEWIWRNF